MKRTVEFAFYVSTSAGLTMSSASFLMLGALLQFVPPLLAFAAVLVGSLLCCLMSMAIAEMARASPGGIGIRTYLKNAFGDPAALFFAYLYLVFMISIAGAESYVFGLAVEAAVPEVPALAISIALIGLVFLVNWIGYEPSRLTQIASTAALVVVLFVLGAIGSFEGTLDLLAKPITLEDWASFPAAVGLSFFLYVGFEWVTTVGSGPEAYQRSIPLAMPVAIGINAVVSALFLTAMMRSVPATELASTPTPHVSFLLALSPWSGPVLVLLLSFLATTSTFNAGLMGGARLIYALAREGSLPVWFTRLSLRTGVPIASLGSLAVLACASTLIFVLGDVYLEGAVIASALICLVYSALMLASFRLLRRRRAGQRLILSWLPLGLAGLDAVLGLFSLVAEPRIIARTMVGTAIAIALAGVGAWLRSRRARSVSTPLRRAA